MSNILIRKALEQKLDTILPALATAWENTQYAPVSGTPYQKVNLLRARPENPTMDSFRTEMGIMQVALFYPLGVGANAAEVRAELIAATFPKGLRLSSGGVNVDINGSAYIMAGSADGDRWMIPVRIPYFSNIT